MSAAPTPSTSSASPLEVRVGETLDGLRTFRAALWVPILLGLIMLFDSWDGIAIAYVMPSLAKEWGLRPAVMGALISSGYFGQFFGAIILSAAAERIGRMPIFLSCVAVMSCLALSTAFAPNYQTLMAIRVVQGLAIGGALPVAVTYINELAPTATRGRYFSIFQFLYLSGFALASGASSIIVPYFGWRWLLALGGVPLLLLPLVMLTLPESPRWLAQTGRGSKVPAAFAKLGTIVSAADFASLDSATPSKRSRRTPTSSLFTAPHRRTTITLIALWFFTYFVNLGLTTWIPSIYVTVYKLPVAEALAYASIASIGFKIMIPFLAMLIDRVGRRPLSIAGSLAATIILAFLSFVEFANVYVLVAVVIVAMLCFSIAPFMVWPYSAEVYPTSVRAIGLGMCSAVARGASMLTPLLIGLILSSGGSVKIVYAIFAACSAVTLLLWLFATTETAGRRLEMA